MPHLGLDRRSWFAYKSESFRERRSRRPGRGRREVRPPTVPATGLPASRPQTQGRVRDESVPDRRPCRPGGPGLCLPLPGPPDLEDHAHRGWPGRGPTRGDERPGQPEGRGRCREPRDPGSGRATGRRESAGRGRAGNADRAPILLDRPPRHGGRTGLGDDPSRHPDHGHREGRGRARPTARRPGRGGPEARSWARRDGAGGPSPVEAGPFDRDGLDARGHDDRVHSPPRQLSGRADARRSRGCLKRRPRDGDPGGCGPETRRGAFPPALGGGPGRRRGGRSRRSARRSSPSPNSPGP